MVGPLFGNNPNQPRQQAQQIPSGGQQARFVLNLHGIIGVILILCFFGVGLWRWTSLPWIYFAAALSGYAVAIIAFTTYSDTASKNIQEQVERIADAQQLMQQPGYNPTGPQHTISEAKKEIAKEQEHSFSAYRLIIGSHCAFFLLAIGFAVTPNDVNLGAYVFLGCIAGGFAIPFMLFRRSP